MDRVLATQMGVKAAELAMEGAWGTMTAYRDAHVVPIPLADATDQLKTVPPELFAVAETFFG
jgi:ATP-dependent phosphofructokinase / diphosphate-dependent phosphofructokinase